MRKERGGESWVWRGDVQEVGMQAKGSGPESRLRAEEEGSAQALSRSSQDGARDQGQASGVFVVAAALPLLP